MSKPINFSSLYLFNKFDKKVLFYIMLSTFFINILALIFPIVLVQVYDRVIPNKSINTLQILVIGVIVALFLELMLRIARSLIITWIDVRMQHELRKKILYTLLRSDIDAIDNKNIGANFLKINLSRNLKEFYLGQVLTTAVDLPFVIIYLIAIAYLGKYVVIVPIFIIIALFIRTYIKTPGLVKELNNKQKTEERKYDLMFEIINDMNIIKALAAEIGMLRRYEQLQRTVAKHNYELGMKLHNTMSYINTLSLLAMAGTGAVGAMLVINDSITIGVMSACFILVSRAIQPANKIIGTWNKYQSIRLSQQEINEVVNMKLESNIDKPNFPKIQKANIKIRDLSYIDQLQNIKVLNDINLTINNHEKILLTFDDTKIKSYIFNLLMGMTIPSNGKIMINDYDIGQFNLDSYRKQIAYLPERAEVFQGTILENISKFRGKYYEERAKSLAKKLGLDNAIAKLPHGFNTKVGYEDFRFMSQGIKQHISIVRELLDEPKIILIDDVTIDMDENANNIVCNYLKKSNTTTIIYSKQASLIELADKQYEFIDGNLKLIKDKQ